MKGGNGGGIIVDSCAWTRGFDIICKLGTVATEDG